MANSAANLGADETAGLDLVFGLRLLTPLCPILFSWLDEIVELNFGLATRRMGIFLASTGDRQADRLDWIDAASVGSPGIHAQRVFNDCCAG